MKADRFNHQVRRRERMEQTTERAKEQCQSGMSLIEVMVSMVVLGIVLVGLGQGLVYGIKLNSENKMRISSLNMCKRVTEDLKTQISQSQTVFDATAQSNNTYYIDADGDKTYTGNGANKKEDFTSSSAFRVNVVTSNSALTQTVGGVTNVLVKVLDVTVVDVQNINKSGRDVRMKLEIIRPSA